MGRMTAYLFYFFKSGIPACPIGSRFAEERRFGGSIPDASSGNDSTHFPVVLEFMS
jgi:hypothetical protein